MNPILVEVLRGEAVESCHRGAFAVLDSAGKVVCAAGDIAAAVYPRSAVKPLQSLPLLASGAADDLGLTNAEIAVACGSHGGEQEHVDTAASMLAKAGFDSSCLACGTHWPLSERAARRLAELSISPSALHNNCSGKHAGFLCVARRRQIDPYGYVHVTHPIMAEVTAALAEVTGQKLEVGRMGIDGCGIPTFAIPLHSLALGFARCATGTGISKTLGMAAQRIFEAIAVSPAMLAGTGCFDTEIAAASGGGVVTKTGAEGVVCAALPALGLGVAIKIDDGGTRAAHAAMAALLIRCIPDKHQSAELVGLLNRSARPALINWGGQNVGSLGPRGPLC